MSLFLLQTELSAWESTAAGIVPFVFYLVIAVAVLALVMTLMNMIKTPKALIGSLIGIGVLAVIFLVAWLMSSSDMPESLVKLGATSGMYKFIGGAIGTAFILMAIGLLFLLFDLVRGLFKF